MRLDFENICDFDFQIELSSLFQFFLPEYWCHISFQIFGVSIYKNIVSFVNLI